MGVKSYEGWKKAPPWNSVGHRDPLGVLTLGRSISSLISVQLEKTKKLSASTQRVDMDRLVDCSIWGPDQGVIILQKYMDYCGIVQCKRHGTYPMAKAKAKVVGDFPKHKACLGSSLDPQPRGACQIPQ